MPSPIQTKRRLITASPIASRPFQTWAPTGVATAVTCCLWAANRAGNAQVCMHSNHCLVTPMLTSLQSVLPPAMSTAYTSSPIFAACPWRARTRSCPRFARQRAANSPQFLLHLRSPPWPTVLFARQTLVAPLLRLLSLHTSLLLARTNRRPSRH